MQWDEEGVTGVGQGERAPARVPAVRDSRERPLVSVIVPTFNRPDTLGLTLESLLSQSYPNVEIIVVNDAGVDVSAVVSAHNHDRNIVYHTHENNQGLAAARNTGVGLASGKYIAYLDDDDVFYPDHVRTLVDFLEVSRYRVAYTDAYRAHQTKVDGRYVTIKKDVPYSFNFDSDRILVTNFVPVLCFMHEKSCLDEVGCFDESLRVLEDWDLWIRMSRKFQFAHIKKVTCEFTWRTDGSSMTSEKQLEFQHTRERIFNKHQEHVVNNPNLRKFLDASVPSSVQASEPPESSAGGTARERQVGRSGIPQNGNGRKPCTSAETEQGLVSIIMLTLNGLEHTRACLASIQKHTPQRHQVVVVDNGSSDGTLEFLRSYTVAHPHVSVISNAGNRGFAGGNNQGLALAQGEYILFLNNDTLVTAGWLERMLAVFRRRPEVGLVGPRSNRVAGLQLVKDASYGSWEEMEAFADSWAQQHAGGMTPVSVAIGFCLLAKRAVVDAIGGWDERFGNGNFEDNDYCHRAAQAGFPSCIADDVFIHHTGGQTFIGAKIDYNGSMKGNWALFKEKWGLPADLAMQTGYGTKSLRPLHAVDLQIPIPNVHADHAADALNRWLHDMAFNREVEAR